MPDWVYRTVAKPVLFALPESTSRALALGVIGTLGRHAIGRALIDFLGHMAPAPSLAVQVGETRFASPIGLGWRVDPDQRATHGLARFGVGCIEQWAQRSRHVQRGPAESLCDAAWTSHENRIAPANSPVPLLLRRLDATGNESLSLPDGSECRVHPWNDPLPSNLAAEREGVVLQVGSKLSDGGWCMRAAMPNDLPEIVKAWRAALPQNLPVIVAGAVACPTHAIALVNAGATLVLLDAGLVFRGPGLVKRCNAALQQQQSQTNTESNTPPPNLFRHAWFWATALGAGLALGGAAALALALTRVLLPYDEHYLELSSEMLRQSMPRMFAFMAHDRATLAGTMLGLGWMYVLLGSHGVRSSVHGARTSIIASAVVGFASFFAFFGFGYFDTLHAFVAAILFQLTVQIMVGSDGSAPTQPSVIDIEDAAWRRAQFGQLLWVIHAGGLLIAGAVILTIGMTSVFVDEDLTFLCMTDADAQRLGARMIGVVAHDRATLGGMLLASGVAMLLPILWIFRRGEAWLWWAIAGMGFFAYSAALGVHFHVSYTDWRHLLPAFAGLFLWSAGLLLTRSYILNLTAASAKT